SDPTRAVGGKSGVDSRRLARGAADHRVGREPAQAGRCVEGSSIVRQRVTMDAEFDKTPSHHSIARFFVENRHVAGVLLVGVVARGIWAYDTMPKRKDPDIPVRQVAVVTPGRARAQARRTTRDP